MVGFEEAAVLQKPNGFDFLASALLVVGEPTDHEFEPGAPLLAYEEFAVFGGESLQGFLFFEVVGVV